MEQITVVYERGVLRPLRPLTIPNHTQLNIQIMPQKIRSDNNRQQILEALADAGLLYITPPSTEPPISDDKLRAAAIAIGADGSLSADIIAERDER